MPSKGTPFPPLPHLLKPILVKSSDIKSYINDLTNFHRRVNEVDSFLYTASPFVKK